MRVIEQIPAQELADYFMSLGPTDAVANYPVLEELAKVSGALVNLFSEETQSIANFLIGVLIAARNPHYVEELLELIRTSDPESQQLLLICTKLTEALHIMYTCRVENIGGRI